MFEWLVSNVLSALVSAALTWWFARRGRGGLRQELTTLRESLNDDFSQALLRARREGVIEPLIDERGGIVGIKSEGESITFGTGYAQVTGHKASSGALRASRVATGGMTSVAAESDKTADQSD